MSNTNATRSRIAVNVERVFKTRDSNQLNEPAYKFISLTMGFIAHYDRRGFAATYSDLRHLVTNLQSSEHSDDLEYNNRWADELDRRGESDRAAIVRELVAIARKYDLEITMAFNARQRAEELRIACTLAEKWGYHLVGGLSDEWPVPKSA